MHPHAQRLIIRRPARALFAGAIMAVVATLAAQGAPQPTPPAQPTPTHAQAERTRPPRGTPRAGNVRIERVDPRDTPPDPFENPDGPIPGGPEDMAQRRLEAILRQVISEQRREARQTQAQAAEEMRRIAREASAAIREARDQSLRRDSREQRLALRLGNDLRESLLRQLAPYFADVDPVVVAVWRSAITDALRGLQPLDVYQSIRLMPPPPGTTGQLAVLAHPDPTAAGQIADRIATQLALNGVALDEVSSPTLQRAATATIEAMGTHRMQGW
jgi:hypothetical protein